MFRGGSSGDGNGLNKNKPSAPDFRRGLFFAFQDKIECGINNFTPDLPPPPPLNLGFDQVAALTGAIDSGSTQSQKQPSSIIENGLSAFRAGDNEKAYNLLIQGLPSFPNDLIAHYFAGTAALNIGKTSEAETLFQTSIEIDPEYLDAHFLPEKIRHLHL